MRPHSNVRGIQRPTHILVVEEVKHRHARLPLICISVACTKMDASCELCCNLQNEPI